MNESCNSAIFGHESRNHARFQLSQEIRNYMQSCFRTKFSDNLYLILTLNNALCTNGITFKQSKELTEYLEVVNNLEEWSKLKKSNNFHPKSRLFHIHIHLTDPPDSRSTRKTKTRKTWKEMFLFLFFSTLVSCFELLTFFVSIQENFTVARANNSNMMNEMILHDEFVSLATQRTSVQLLLSVKVK